MSLIEPEINSFAREPFNSNPLMSDDAPPVEHARVDSYISEKIKF